jgi:uncharacterized protein YbaR (Trm112 family)
MIAEPGIQCPIGLPRSKQTRQLILLSRSFDENGYERGDRINGFCKCPACRLWWPIVEEPDAWELDEESGKWFAVEWWGGSVCAVCNLLMVEQPDGTSEVYDLGEGT